MGKVRVVPYNIRHLERMGSESVVIFILKLCVEKRPEVIFTLRFLCRQTKKPQRPLNKRLVRPRIDRDALENYKIICTCQESKQGTSTLFSGPVPILTALYWVVGGLHENG